MYYFALVLNLLLCVGGETISLTANQTTPLLAEQCDGDATMSLLINTTTPINIITTSADGVVISFSFYNIRSLNQLITSYLNDNYYTVSALARIDTVANIDIELNCDNGTSLTTLENVAIAIGAVCIIVAMCCIVHRLCKMKHSLPTIP